MTDLELFQRALDDLLHVSDGLECLETIAALQDRLAQSVPEPFGWYDAEHDEMITNSWYLEQRKNNPSDDSGFSIPLYTAPPQTKLEPVGYYYRGRFSTEKNAPGIGIYGVPVYTAPPQREWLELTDEEIEQCAVDDGSDDLIFARAIEAKSKEKNAI